MSNKFSRPELADKNANIAEYDIIFLGFPVWWYVAPTIINTFLESYDFSDKTVIPFCTSGNSGISTSENNIRNLVPIGEHFFVMCRNSKFSAKSNSGLSYSSTRTTERNPVFFFATFSRRRNLSA